MQQVLGCGLSLDSRAHDTARAGSGPLGAPSGPYRDPPACGFSTSPVLMAMWQCVKQGQLEFGLQKTGLQAVAMTARQHSHRGTHTCCCIAHQDAHICTHTHIYADVAVVAEHLLLVAGRGTEK